jgi:hypothetical protein
VPDIDDVLPMPASQPPVPAAGAPKPPAPPPPRPAAPSAPKPPAAPAIKPAAREPDACPQCGRKNAGRPGARYCMVCDQTY